MNEGTARTFFSFCVLVPAQSEPLRSNNIRNQCGLTAAAGK